MKKFIIIVFYSVLLSSCNSQENAQREWNTIHQKLDDGIESYLKNEGYLKMTYYFDRIKQLDGEWKRYGWVEINEDFILINCSSIPNQKLGYNYLLVFSNSKNEVIYISEPFYDYSLNIESVSKKKNKLIITVRLVQEEVDEKDRKYEIIQLDY